MDTSTAIQSFSDISTQISLKSKSVAAALPANTAQVWPGGATFSTIQAAIDSITGANPQTQYQVAVGAGTFNENIVMKDYVYVIGAGQGVTIITAPGQMNFAAGTVNSASGCGISEVTINATGGGWGTCPMGIKIVGSGSFHISGVTINSTDGGTGGNNVRGISNETGSYSGNIIFGQSIMQCSGVSETTAVGIESFGTPGGSYTVFINVSSIEVDGPGSFGVTGAVYATTVLDNSKIIAATWALYNSDGMSPITANQCTIDGPISGGVVVNP